MDVVIKIILMIVAIGLMAAPMLFEYLSFCGDKKRKISHKRLRLAIFAVVYAVAVTLVMYFAKEILLWFESLSFIQWLIKNLKISDRADYLVKVMAAIVLNIAIGVLFVLVQKPVKIGLKKKNLLQPKKENGEYSLAQKIERKAIKFFHTETWFYVGRTLGLFGLFLSAAYAVVFIVYQIPAYFSAEWIPYEFISMIFGAGYIYPMITLIVIWETYFFLEGIRLVDKECSEILTGEDLTLKNIEANLKEIDEEGQKVFGSFFVRDVEPVGDSGETNNGDHEDITSYIAQSVQNDKRNPQKVRESYLNCLDEIVRGENGVLVNGSFFSEFSVYFLRYLSIIVARGDNVVFVCNNDEQIDLTYEYVNQGLSEISSIFFDKSQSVKKRKEEIPNFDHPIWRMVKISGEHDVLDESTVDDNSILVTSLNYLCSTDFEANHSNFINLIDTIVFVDALDTVNEYNRQLSMLNTRLLHLTSTNSMLAKNHSKNEGFKVKYMSRQVRYICFDDTKTPGLENILENMLSVEFSPTDAMLYNSATMVRLYKGDGVSVPQIIDSEKKMDVVSGMAVLCSHQGAPLVSVFAEGAMPYANMKETMSANMSQVGIAKAAERILFNKCIYNPDNYSVVVAMDSHCNLPATVRKYSSMVSDKPVLLIVFSPPYMFRDYYMANIDDIWQGKQLMRIPVAAGTKKDIAQKILIKANAGGITEKEILLLAKKIPKFDKYVTDKNVNAILREVLEIYGVPQEDRIDVFEHFEYFSIRGFDENGIYSPQDRVVLRRYGRVFDIINGRDMVKMLHGDKEYTLSVPKSRLTQNYIEGQNLLYNGKVYHIDRIDTKEGRVYVTLPTSGRNCEAYQYLQTRNYRVECSADKIEYFDNTKHIKVNIQKDDIRIGDIYISAFRAPTDVVTERYYEIDPYLMAVDYSKPKAFVINDPGNIKLSKQTYRKYGEISSPFYSPDSISRFEPIKGTNGALMLSVRLSGAFGPDINKTMALAAVMLNEVLHSMFPTVADAVTVCPVLHGELKGADAARVLEMSNKLTVIGQESILSTEDFELLIIEDSNMDLGVVSTLISAADDIMSTLFTPILSYLKWYSESEKKSDYLYYGLGREPDCFDFASLGKLAEISGTDNSKFDAVDIEALTESCDFCGKKYSKGGDVFELEDGRHMCKTCASNLVGNDKKVLMAHLERARNFLENTYGITLADDYEFCFESTVKIVNALKQDRNLIKCCSGVPLKSYVDDDKKVHVEYSIPSVNLSELLVRELTHVWQLHYIPELAEDLAEGHMGLVAVQYLRFLNQSQLASVRSNYYENASSTASEGYRKLVRALLSEPKYGNNPFIYLLEMSGGSSEDAVIPPPPRIIEASDYGRPYTPEQPDRVLDGNIKYFYYERLSPRLKTAYDVIFEAIKEHRASVSLEGYTFDEVDKAVDSIRYDRPELFYFRSFSKAVVGSEVFLNYVATVEETAALNSRMESVVAEYLKDIDDTMSAYDVTIRLHIKVIKSVDYDSIALEQEEAEGGPSKDKIDYLRTICGVFLNGKAVCEGYARAMQYLLQKCGIECAESVGFIINENGEKDGAHAWNIVLLDGDYYYLDTTWDDRSNTVQTVKKTDFGLRYFCITSDELLRTRDVSLCPVVMPECVARRCNYYTHNDLVIDSYDPGKIKSIAAAAAEKKEKAFTFKCASRKVYDETLDKMFINGDEGGDVIKFAAKKNKEIDTGGYSYSHCNNIWTVTVTFKFKQ